MRGPWKLPGCLRTVIVVIALLVLLVLLVTTLGQ